MINREIVRNRSKDHQVVCSTLRQSNLIWFMHRQYSAIVSKAFESVFDTIFKKMLKYKAMYNPYLVWDDLFVVYSNLKQSYPYYLIWIIQSMLECKAIESKLIWFDLFTSCAWISYERICNLINLIKCIHNMLDFN